MAAFGTRNLIFKVDGVDYSADVSNVTVDGDESDSDFMSFAEARSGGARMYKLNLTYRQDNGTSALWYKNWSQAGSTVSYELWPNGGGASATLAQPKYAGTVVIVEPNGTLVGGDADKSTTNVFTSEAVWDCTGKPALTP